jgi:DNA segregation ATPase FtsK/SpoIIIE, S-DNA-T family
VGPDHLSMILVDYKGGSTFDACARLPHTVGVVTDLDDGLAERVLVSLDAEVRRRERLLRAAGVDDLAGYRRTASTPMARVVVVIDEFATRWR